MQSHALSMYELHRQELLAEAAYARRLEHFVPAVASGPCRAHPRLADLRLSIVAALASLRPALHLPSQATAN